MGATGTISAQEWEAKLALYDRRCAYCGKQPPRLHMEHMIPLSRGGSHSIDNVVPSCPSCNLRKGTKTPSEFLLHLESQRQAA